MNDKGIHLSEQQLARLFQANSQNHRSKSTASDCLSTMAGSSTRLQHVEDLVSDGRTAQAMKAAMACKDWSQEVAADIKQSKRPWFNFLGLHNPLKTTVATAAFALAMVVAVPQFTQINDQEQQHVPVFQDMVQNDVIGVNRFDPDPDTLSKGGFDNQNNATKQDSLFGGTFG